MPSHLDETGVIAEQGRIGLGADAGAALSQDFARA